MYTGKTQTLIVASCLAVILLTLRVIESGSFNYIFLAWNLLLAWVPYLASGWLWQLNPAHKWKANTLLVAWLLFLPNAPYLITDFIHLQKRPGIPLLSDLVMLFLFSCTGLALGLISVQRTEYWWRQNRLCMAASRLRIIVFLLCGFGIYLGRVERWNSWDVLANPGELATGVLNKCIHPLAHMHVWGLTVLFALLIWIPYMIINTLPAKSMGGNNHQL